MGNLPAKTDRTRIACKRPVTDVPFPKLWTQTKLNGNALPPMGYDAYKVLTVLLPVQHKKLALGIPNTYSSYRLFVNNEMFAYAGYPDSIPARAKHRWVEHTLELSGNQDALNLILLTAIYRHSKGVPYKDILTGIPASHHYLFYNGDR